jgi:DNA helicase-2/ATP-dependent DNA helicase PcrA
VVFLTGLEDGVFPHLRALGDPRELEEERRLAYVGITRARQRLYVSRAMVRSAWGAPAHNPPSRFLGELPDSVVRERLRPASWSNYGAPTMAPVQPRSDLPDLQTGDSVRHGSLGEGVITQIEPGGLVTVRFAGDGSERKLMLEYAPLEKIA